MAGENGDVPGAKSKAADVVNGGEKPAEGNALNQEAAQLMVTRQPGNEIDGILSAHGLTQSLATPEPYKATILDDIVENNPLARLGLVTMEGAGYAVPGVMNAAVHDITNPVEALEKAGHALGLGVLMRVGLPKAGAARAAAATAFTYFMARDAVVPVSQAYSDVWSGGNHADVNLAAQKMGDGLGMFGWDAYWGMKIAGAGERLGEKGMKGIMGEKKFNSFESTKGDFLGSDKYFVGRHLNNLGNKVDKTSQAFADRLIGGKKPAEPTLTFEEKMVKARESNAEHEIVKSLATMHKHGVKTTDGHDVGYTESLNIFLAGMDPRKLSSTQLAEFNKLMGEPKDVPPIVLPKVTEMVAPKAAPEATIATGDVIKGSTPELAAKIKEELDPKNITELAKMAKNEMERLTDEQQQVIDLGENATGAVHAAINPKHAALDPGYKEWLNQMIALNNEVGGDQAKLQQVAPLFFRGRDAAIGQMSADLGPTGANVHSLNLFSLEMYTGLKQRMTAAGIKADDVLAAKNPPLNLVARDGGAGPHTIPEIQGVWDVDLIHWPRNMQNLRMLRASINGHENKHDQWGGILRFAEDIRETVIGKTVSKALGDKANEIVDVPGHGQMSKQTLIVEILKAQANENTADIGGAAHTGPNGGIGLGILLQALRQDGKLETRNVFGKEMEVKGENPMGIEVHAMDTFRPKLVAEVLRQRAAHADPKNPDPMLLEYAKQLDAYAEAASNGGKDYVWASIDHPGQKISIPRAEMDAVIPHLVNAQFNTPLPALGGKTYGEMLPNLPKEMKKMDAIADMMVDAITNNKPLSSIPFNTTDYSMIQLQGAALPAALRLASKGMAGPEINAQVNRVSDHLEALYRKGDPHVEPLTPRITAGRLILNPSLAVRQTGKGVGHAVEAARTWENRDRFLVGYGGMAIGRDVVGTFEPGSASQALVQKGNIEQKAAEQPQDTTDGAVPPPQRDTHGGVKTLETDRIIIPPGDVGPSGQPRSVPKPFDPFMGRPKETQVDGKELRRLQREGQDWIDQQSRPATPPTRK
ncbi:MAG: hypothetical protein SGJ27_01940 [Candidatus Melainabacteria bacterium]|nr:hypothetical protein [Candidatus Melainabacteria bacterium]